MTFRPRFLYFCAIRDRCANTCRHGPHLRPEMLTGQTPAARMIALLSQPVRKSLEGYEARPFYKERDVLMIL